MPGKINDNIKSIRELKNYTQEYMALELGMTQAGYSKIEKGANHTSFEKIEAIASIFEMDLQSVIEFERGLYLGAPAAKSGTASQLSGFFSIEGLYRDKISLLEKLLERTDRELRRYKDRYGSF